MIKTTRFTTETINELVKVLRADCIEFVAGSLLDNALYCFMATADNVGWMAVYERFETTNSSYYYVEIADTKKQAEALCRRWYEFQYNADQNVED